MGYPKQPLKPNSASIWWQNKGYRQRLLITFQITTYTWVVKSCFPIYPKYNNCQLYPDKLSTTILKYTFQNQSLDFTNFALRIYPFFPSWDYYSNFYKGMFFSRDEIIKKFAVWKFQSFLSLRFYVKSILRVVEVRNLPFLHI